MHREHSSITIVLHMDMACKVCEINSVLPCYFISPLLPCSRFTHIYHRLGPARWQFEQLLAPLYNVLSPYPDSALHTLIKVHLSPPPSSRDF